MYNKRVLNPLAKYNNCEYSFSYLIIYIYMDNNIKKVWINKYKNSKQQIKNKLYMYKKKYKVLN